MDILLTIQQIYVFINVLLHQIFMEIQFSNDVYIFVQKVRMLKIIRDCVNQAAHLDNMLII